MIMFYKFFCHLNLILNNDNCIEKINFNTLFFLWHLLFYDLFVYWWEVSLGFPFSHATFDNESHIPWMNAHPTAPSSIWKIQIKLKDYICRKYGVGGRLFTSLNNLHNNKLSVMLQPKNTYLQPNKFTNWANPLLFGNLV